MTNWNQPPPYPGAPMGGPPVAAGSQKKVSGQVWRATALWLLVLAGGMPLVVFVVYRAPDSERKVLNMVMLAACAVVWATSTVLFGFLISRGHAAWAIYRFTLAGALAWLMGVFAAFMVAVPPSPALDPDTGHPVYDPSVADFTPGPGVPLLTPVAAVAILLLLHLGGHWSLRAWRSHTSRV